MFFFVGLLSLGIIILRFIHVIVTIVLLCIYPTSRRDCERYGARTLSYVSLRPRHPAQGWAHRKCLINVLRLTDWKEDEDVSVCGKGRQSCVARSSPKTD